jgi:hypothetical protein
MNFKVDAYSTLDKVFLSAETHSVPIWETIAVELARQILKGKQEPFHTIHEEFLCAHELSEGDVEAINSCLVQFDPNLLLGTLYEFIETYIKHCPLQEHDQLSVI